MQQVVKTPDGELTFNSMAEVVKLYQQGFISPDDLVRPADSTRWVKAGTLAVLRGTQSRGTRETAMGVRVAMAIAFSLALAGAFHRSGKLFPRRAACSSRCSPSVSGLTDLKDEPSPPSFPPLLRGPAHSRCLRPRAARNPPRGLPWGGPAFRRDALAGIVVGVVALPLSMALAIAVGVPPQHGLYTAIIAGVTVALLGGSRTQVTGPTAAFVVILAPIVTKIGLAGLLLSGFFAGLILIAMGLLRMGRLIEFIPHPVTTGFTAGIGTVIASIQLKDLLGLHPAARTDGFLERLASFAQARHTASLAESLLGLGALFGLIYLPRWVKKIPAPLLVLPAAAIVAAAIHHLAPGVSFATIGSTFHTEVGGAWVAGIPGGSRPCRCSPGGPPRRARRGSRCLSWTTLRTLILPGAFAIAMLGAIESLLSAVVADGMLGTKHDPDAELLALGVGNLLVPFFGGIPATGAIARTATGIRNGARSPISSAVHAVTVLLAVLLFAPLIGYLPMTSLAALLLLVAWNMSDAGHALHIARTAPRSDIAVLLTCFLLTVIFDMVKAVSVGVVLASLLFTKRMAELTRTELRTGEAAGLPADLPPGVVVYDVYGPLFFGAAQRAMAALGHIADTLAVMVLRVEQVPAIDSTGLEALESALEILQARRVPVILTGLQPQPRRALLKAGICERPGVLLFRHDLQAALSAARQLSAYTPPPPLVPAEVSATGPTRF